MTNRKENHRFAANTEIWEVFHCSNIENCSKRIDRSAAASNSCKKISANKTNIEIDPFQRDRHWTNRKKNWTRNSNYSSWSVFVLSCFSHIWRREKSVRQKFCFDFVRSEVFDASLTNTTVKPFKRENLFKFDTRKSINFFSRQIRIENLFRFFFCFFTVKISI